MSAYPPHPRQTLLDRLVLNTVRDERGVRVRPLRGSRRRAAMRGWDRRHDFDRVRRRLVTRTVRYPVYALLALFVGGSVGFLVFAWVFGGEGLVAAICFFVAGGSVMLLVPLGVVHQHLDDRASVRAMLATQMCLRCAYDLEGAPVDSAGVCVCPECGAAWRLGSLS